MQVQMLLDSGARSDVLVHELVVSVWIAEQISGDTCLSIHDMLGVRVLTASIAGGRLGGDVLSKMWRVSAIVQVGRQHVGCWRMLLLASSGQQLERQNAKEDFRTIPTYVGQRSCDVRSPSPLYSPSNKPNTPTNDGARERALEDVEKMSRKHRAKDPKVDAAPSWSLFLLSTTYHQSHKHCH